MKIAVCFSGQIRTGVHVVKNIKNYIGDLYQYCDFFVHTWDVESISMNDLNTMISDGDLYQKNKNIVHKIDNSKFTNFYSIYNPISMVVEPYLMFNYRQLPGGRRYNNNTKSEVISLFESIHECNKLKINHEEKYNFKYDYVVRLRPDLVIHPEKSLEEDLFEISDDVLLFAGFKNRDYSNRIDDIFWISKSEIMDKISPYYDYESKTNYDRESIDYDWQEVMFEWVNNILGIKPIKLKNSVICPYYISDLEMNVDVMGAEIYGRQY